MAQAALPAPDIEIGSRRPVNFILPGIFAGECDPLHKGREKFPGRLHAGDSHPDPDGPLSRVWVRSVRWRYASERAERERAHIYVREQAPDGRRADWAWSSLPALHRKRRIRRGLEIR